VTAQLILCLGAMVAALQEAFHRWPDVGTKEGTHHAEQGPRKRNGGGRRRRKEEERKEGRAAIKRGRGWCTKQKSGCSDARWMAERRCCATGIFHALEMNMMHERRRGNNGYLLARTGTRREAPRQQQRHPRGSNNSRGNQQRKPASGGVLQMMCWCVGAADGR
jgi:hypothetical protein